MHWLKSHGYEQIMFLTNDNLQNNYATKTNVYEGSILGLRLIQYKCRTQYGHQSNIFLYAKDILKSFLSVGKKQQRFVNYKAAH